MTLIKLRIGILMDVWLPKYIYEKENRHYKKEWRSLFALVVVKFDLYNVSSDDVI